MMMLANAMEKAGTTTDRKKITSGLAGEHDKSIAGTYSFDSEGNLTGAPTTIYVIRNGFPAPFQIE